MLAMAAPPTLLDGGQYPGCRYRRFGLPELGEHSTYEHAAANEHGALVDIEPRMVMGIDGLEASLRPHEEERARHLLR